MKHRWITIAIAVAILASVIGFIAWYKLDYVLPQPSWIGADQRDTYFYGSVEPQKAEGIPYWLWLAMPRIFPEENKVPGGYAAFALSWQQGREMPVGFAKQKAGYIRVTGNCAICHVMSQPTGSDLGPRILTAVTGKTTDINPLLDFFRNCAADPRFNADEFFSEIDSDTSLSLVDKLVYRYVLIPRTRKALMKDPAQVLLGPAMLAHRDHPTSDAPFADPQMRLLRDYIRAQSQVHQP